jgi:ABC-type transport system involved in multi-copper enzyme maturation permease subunit
MLGGLIRAQILENLYGIKFIVTFIVCLILVIAGTISGIGKYQGQLRDQADIINTNEASMMESGSWWSAARLGQKVVKPATRLVLFSSGLEESVGRTATVKEGDFPQMEDSIYSTAPIFAVFGDIDLTFIIKIVISLFAILFTYDLVSGEKERGTLKLCLSNSVPRNTYILGKSIGSFISMLIPLIIPMAIAMLILLTLGDMNFSGDEWARVGLIILGYTFYMMAFFSVGIFVSTMTKKSAVSFLILLFIWVIIVLILPKTAMLVAGQMNPIPTVNEVRAEQMKLRQQFNTTVWERTAEEFKKTSGAEVNWSSRESRRQMFDIRNRIRTELEPIYVKDNEKLVDDFKKKQSNLTNLAITMSRLSPASAVTYLGMNLAGTGYADQEAFLKQLTGHRERFAAFIEDEQEKERRDRSDRRMSKTSQGELDISGMPKFSYTRLSLAESFELVLPDLAALIIVSILFYLLAFVMFLRYDVR